MADQIERRGLGNMERHLQTILITFITGSIVFAANYFFTDKESKAVLLTNMNHITAQVAEIRADIRTMRQEQASKAKVDELEARLRAVETSLVTRHPNR
jgi:hypothetical protein